MESEKPGSSSKRQVASTNVSTQKGTLSGTIKTKPTLLVKVGGGLKGVEQTTPKDTRKQVEVDKTQPQHIEDHSHTPSGKKRKREPKGELSEVTVSKSNTWIIEAREDEEVMSSQEEKTTVVSASKLKSGGQKQMEINISGPGVGSASEALAQRSQEKISSGESEEAQFDDDISSLPPTPTPMYLREKVFASKCVQTLLSCYKTHVDAEVQVQAQQSDAEVQVQTQHCDAEIQVQAEQSNSSTQVDGNELLIEGPIGGTQVDVNQVKVNAIKRAINLVRVGNVWIPFENIVKVQTIKDPITGQPDLLYALSFPNGLARAEDIIIATESTRIEVEPGFTDKEWALPFVISPAIDDGVHFFCTFCGKDQGSQVKKIIHEVHECKMPAAPKGLEPEKLIYQVMPKFSMKTICAGGWKKVELTVSENPTVEQFKQGQSTQNLAEAIQGDQVQGTNQTEGERLMVTCSDKTPGVLTTTVTISEPGDGAKIVPHVASNVKPPTGTKSSIRQKIPATQTSTQSAAHVQNPLRGSVTKPGVSTEKSSSTFKTPAIKAPAHKPAKK